MAAELRVPGDKSISHRALLLASLADGTSVVRHLNTGADLEATAEALRALGVELDWDHAENVARVRGRAPFRDPERVLDCRNSGTTARLVLGLLAGLGCRASLTGDASLRRRPMDRVVQPLRAMGASVLEESAPGRLPLTVTSGVTRAGAHASPVASAQVKGALLLAGVAAGLPVSVTEPFPSRDHTERMLRARGGSVETDRRGGGLRVSFQPGPAALRAIDCVVPGDLSAAMFWIVWAILAGRPGAALRVREVGLNPTRTGALEVLGRMGARVTASNVREEGGELVGDLAVEPGRLRGTEIAADDVPSLIDEVPVLAVAAARAEGAFSLRGGQELRVKESDRIAAIVSNLQALGVEAEERPDGFRVRGTDRPLRGRVRTGSDHRIAMAFGVLAAQPGNSIELDAPACAAVSYPGFWQELARLRAEG